MGVGGRGTWMMAAGGGGGRKDEMGTGEKYKILMRLSAVRMEINGME